MPEAFYGQRNCWLTVVPITHKEFGTERESMRLALEAENIESDRSTASFGMQIPLLLGQP